MDFGRRKSVEQDPWDSPGKLERLMLTKVNLKQSKTFQITGKNAIDWSYFILFKVKLRVFRSIISYLCLKIVI